MPTLHWKGREEILDHHRDVPFTTLVRQYSFDSDGQHLEDNGSKNMIIHGDNLLALKSLLPKYEGRVKCIYIDPPYNTGESVWVYKDNMNSPTFKEWFGKVVGKEGEDFSRHDKWLCMMYPRLQLLKRLLSKDGVIFISIDDGEQAALTQICMEIFGRSNFVCDIPWRKRTAKSDVPHGISSDCEHIVCFAKSPAFKAAVVHERTYFHTEDFPNRRWRYHDLTKQTSADERENSFFTIVNPKTGEEYPPDELRTWCITKDTFPKYYAENRIIFPGDYDDLKISKPVMRYWEDEDEKKAGEDFGYTAASSFLPSDIVGMTKDGGDECIGIFGRKQFNFPKPSSLIQYLIKMSTYNDPNAIILDSFAGSGTTAHAVIKLNNEDGGNRQFILIETENYAEETTAERVRRVISGYDTKKKVDLELYSKRITVKGLKNGPKLYDEAFDFYEQIDKSKYSSVDKPKLINNTIVIKAKIEEDGHIEGIPSSFSFYEFGPTIIDENGKLSQNIPIDQLRSYVWYTESKQSSPVSDPENPYYLGNAYNVDYYFYYEEDKKTCLNKSFMESIPKNKDGYVIYADFCTLTDRDLESFNITFKKIPRSIQFI